VQNDKVETFYPCNSNLKRLKDQRNISNYYNRPTKEHWYKHEPKTFEENSQTKETDKKVPLGWWLKKHYPGYQVTQLIGFKSLLAS